MEVKEEEDEDEDEDIEEDEEEDGEDIDLDDWELDLFWFFDFYDLWCEECNNVYFLVCLKYGFLYLIFNWLVFICVRVSLFLVFYIDRFLGGVFFKWCIFKCI